MIDSKSNTWKCGICWWFSEESKDMVPLFSIIHLQQVLFSSVISKLNYILSRERRVYHIYKQKDQMKNDFLIAIIFKGLSLLVRILYKKNVCVYASQVKNLPANSGDLRDSGSIPGSGRPPWKRAWQPNPVFVVLQRVGHNWSDLAHTPMCVYKFTLRHCFMRF